MRRIFFSSALGVLLLASLSPVVGQTQGGGKQPASPRLQKVVDGAARAALERFKEKGFAEKNLAVTLDYNTFGIKGPIAEALRFANAAAAISVTRMGAQASVPSRAEVDQFLAAGSGNIPARRQSF